MTKELEKILKSADMRKEMQKVVEETIQSPLMQTKWQELILKSGGQSASESGASGKKSEEETKKEETK